MEAQLVTGATGFVGAAIVLRLLETSDVDIYCVVRGDRPDRVHEVLSRTAAHYGQGESHAAQSHRIRAIRGDLAAPMLGVQPNALPAIGQLWHCAASLRHAHRHAEHIHRTNVTGTAEAVKLARRVGAEINHVSTAYVGHTGDGVRRELINPDSGAGVNQYIRSKMSAELVLSESGMPWRILRPSLVVGHSGTYAADTMAGLYGIARIVHMFDSATRTLFGGLPRDRPLRLWGDPAGEANWITVDAVAQLAVTTGLHGPLATVFHLTNPIAPTIRDTAQGIADWIGLPTPEFVPPGTTLGGIDWAVNNAMCFFTPYMAKNLWFSRDNTDLVVGRHAGATKLTPEIITGMLRWYERHQLS